MMSYGDLVRRGHARHGDRFSEIGLAEYWRPWYESQTRVRVRMSTGEVLTGTVAATTGWQPSFMLMRTSRSLGSIYLLGIYDRVIAVQRNGRYVEVAS